ncbi:prokineticin-2 isoform X1 [Peromyscus maniculatus bairdii]|uniref:prokineticin-2 isoform X1 n=1 Tax=Peromyscus maniculatus bairdii TaxID=230844 RepID=UPI001C2EFD11|nr:prokineticin-2 isoform X1 [Peromyscus maniculatus bairdii]
MGAPRCAPLLLLLLLPLLLTPPAGDAAVITGACDKDSQCGGGMCCAVSIWVKSIRICTPMGQVGDSCHPLTRKVSVCAGTSGSILGAENASHLSLPARLGVFTDFFQPVYLFGPEVIPLK